MMQRYPGKHVHTDQRGMASFIITFVLMLIISLITLNFAQIIRREQRQALDRNLSSRAFYAAESGINAAVDALKNGYNTAKTDCAPDASAPLNTSAYTLDGTTSTEVSCLTIDNSPPTLEYPNLVRGRSQVVPLNGSSNLAALQFSWQSKTATTTPPTSYASCNSANGLTPQASWGCTAPLLRIDMVDTSGAIDRNSLVNNVSTMFLYPTNGGGSPTTNFSPGNQGIMANARCSAVSTPKHCNITINMPGASSRYYARIVSYYADASLVITPRSGVGSPVTLSGAQAVIDSTGKALDVARRIQVRKSLTGSGVVPEFGIDGAAGLCKRYLVMAGNGTPGSTVLQLSAAGTLHDGSPCAID